MPDDLRQIVEHGRAELVTADLMVGRHQHGGYGLCHCGRDWECNVHAQWSAYACYWRARLDVLEPRLAALKGKRWLPPMARNPRVVDDGVPGSQPGTPFVS